MLAVQTFEKAPKTLRLAPNSRRKYPFQDMDVDQFFFVEGREKNNLATHASVMGKKLGRKFSTKLAYMVLTEEGWVLATANDDGATIGIWVGRIA